MDQEIQAHQVLHSALDFLIQALAEKQIAQGGGQQGTATAIVLFAIVEKAVAQLGRGGQLHEAVFEAFELLDFLGGGVQVLAQLVQALTVNRFHALLFGLGGDPAHAARQVRAELHGDAKTHKVHDKTHEHQGHGHTRRGHDDLARCDGDGSNGSGRAGYPHELHEWILFSGRGSLILIDRWCQGLNTLKLRVFSRMKYHRQAGNLALKYPLFNLSSQ